MYVELKKKLFVNKLSNYYNLIIFEFCQQYFLKLKFSYWISSPEFESNVKIQKNSDVSYDAIALKQSVIIF